MDKLNTALNDTKFRIVSQGDLLVMDAIQKMTNPNASSLVLHITMNQGRMMALSQLSPILKMLQEKHLITQKESSSSQTGRPMMLYNLTRRGERVLELGKELVFLIAKNGK